MSLKPFPIVGLTKGLQTNVKPAMLPAQAYPVLNNAYIYWERLIKREGRQLLGRLRRLFTNEAIGNSTAGTWTFNLYAVLVPPVIPEANAQIQPGSVVITIHAGADIVFTDQGNGTLTSPTAGNSGIINYLTGSVTLTHTGGVSPTNLTFAYYPSLPVMGIIQREIAAINDEETIFFDTVYAYKYTSGGFEEYIPGTTWDGQNYDLFWGYNYRGTDASDRLLFVTNGSQTAGSPIRYTDGTTWTTFAPAITNTRFIYQCRIIVAYYGRLLLLNTWEGDSGIAAASNFFNRCRFSQLGTPISADAFRSDQFGKGGFLDAPTNEAIIGATFIKNTLVVDFEKSTWQLRYVGEYGLPFIWERVSVDYGSESTFSGIVFDNHRLSIGDKAITIGTATGVERLDLDNPRLIFDFQNANNGVKRITGVRDYDKELVYWNYADASTQAAPGVSTTYPNTVLVYNYRNQTFSQFDDSITYLGTFQSSTGVTWSDLDVYWDSEDVFWNDADTQSLFPLIVAGNQDGFISTYGYKSPSQLSTVPLIDQETLFIKAIDLTTVPITITSPDHNLQFGDIIYISNMLFVDGSNVPVATNLNDKLYQVVYATPSSKDTFCIQKWNFTTKQYDDSFAFTPPTSSTYIGGGVISKMPKMNVLTKDINIFQGKSMQTKTSYLDFLFQPEVGGAVTVKLFLNASTRGSTPGTVGDNNLVWNANLSIDAIAPYYTPNSDYTWFRYYATLSAQYFSINVTYNDDLMNSILTHQQPCVLYGIVAWCREGGKNVY